MKKNEELFDINLQLFADGGEGDPPVDDPKDKPQDPPADKSPKEPEKLQMTQEELDTLITKRLKREKEKYADYDDIKTKLTDFEKAEEKRKRAGKTELENLQGDLEKVKGEKETMSQQLETLQKQVQQGRITNEFIKLANKYNIEYIDDALKLADLSAVKIGEEGKVEGVEDVIKALVENKPYLVKQTKEPKQIGGASQGKPNEDKTSEQLLKEAAEKARKTGRLEDRVAFAKLKSELQG